MPLYVYAIVNRPFPRALARQKRVRLRSVPGGGIVAVVADRNVAPPPTISALRRHDAVVRRIARAAPAVLPVRFGTLFDTDRALAAVLRVWSADLRKALRLVKEREQMTLRVFGTAAAGRPPESRARESEAEKKPGTRYLARLARARARAQSAPELEPLRQALAPLLAAERISRHDAGPLVLTAYHLIPRGSARAYGAVLRRHAAALGLRAAASGPWPPYAFVPELGA